MRLQHKYFQVNFRKFLRTILQIICEWLILTICCLNLQNLTKLQLKCLFQSLRKKKVNWMWGSEVIKTIMLKMNILKCFPRYLEWAVGNIVSDWVLIPLANINPASYVPLALKILICLPGHTNSPNNSNTMNMFNNNTYANFKTAYKHIISAMVSCLRIIWITNSSDHGKIWTVNLLHMKLLPNLLDCLD